MGQLSITKRNIEMPSVVLELFSQRSRDIPHFHIIIKTRAIDYKCIKCNDCHKNVEDQK